MGSPLEKLLSVAIASVTIDFSWVWGLESGPLGSDWVNNGLWLAQVEFPLTISATTLRLLSITLLILLNGFFVTAEFSIVSVRRSRIRQLVLAGDDQARVVEKLQRSFDRLLSTTQLGITLSSLALGWIGERTMAIILSSAIWHLPLSPTVRTNLAHTLAIPLAFCFLVYLQIIFGELCPKAVALLYPEQLARFLGPPSLVIAQIFHPFIWILNKSTHLLLGGVGIHYSGQGTYSRVTPEELQLIISTASESIGLEAEERQLLNNVFEFGEVTVADVMIPRTQLITISLQATLGELLQEVVDSGHSRYPVFGESLDDIRGIIQLKELADPLIQKLQESHGCPMTITPWIHPVRFVPEYMLLGELLPLMQRLGQSMVIVVDEYGGTAGLVTLKDVVEEIIGEGVDTQDLSEAKIRRLDSHTFIVQAQLDLEEVNKLLNVEFPLGDDYNTLGGFLIHQLQKIPAQGESLTFGPLQLTVTAAEGPRLQQIQVRRFDGLGDP